MKKLTREAFEEIRLWVYRNARPIELVRWRYHFENGGGDAVLSALSWYQNADGGFGQGLEPDSWNPHSSPYTTLNAIGKLDEIHFTDTTHPLMRGLFRYLESGAHTHENGWQFSIPSNDGYPRAPWWTYDANANEYESIGVSAGLAAFLLRLAGKDTDAYRRGRSVAERLFSNLGTTENYGEMGIGGYLALKDIMVREGLSDRFDLQAASAMVKEAVNGAIERDVSKWAFYGKRPSSFINAPDSEYYEDNQEIMQKELDYLIDTRPEQGVWGITWSWFENNEKFPKEFAISENWWKSEIAISTLLLLRNFGRLDG